MCIQCKIEKYEKIFVNQEIDDYAMFLLKEKDLIELNIPKGPRLKINNYLFEKYNYNI